MTDLMTHLPWPWISRNVEPTIEKWVKTSCSVVLIRGHRRCGKSSTVQRVCENLKIPSVIIYIKNDVRDIIEEFGFKLTGNKNSVQSIFEISDLILHHIREGKILILKEIQNCCDSLQVVLQEACDRMGYEIQHHYKHWKNAGSLFLMGSLPGLVDTMVESRKNPLFQRIFAKVTIFSFDTSELMNLFDYFEIQDENLMLSLYSFFGGKPFLYRIANEHGLLKGNQTCFADIVKEFLASESQQSWNDAIGNVEQQLGLKFSVAVKAVKKESTKLKQIKYIAEELKISQDEAYSMLFNDLYKRYGVIRPVFSIKNLDSIYCFKIDDPMIELSSKLSFNDLGFRREDVIREPNISPDIFHQVEGFHLEKWIREIAEDRHMLLKEKSFPFLQEDRQCEFLPSVIWEFANIEIDLIASQPSTNTIIVGSCKRSHSKINHANLTGHWEALQKEKCFHAVLSNLKLKMDNLVVHFVHFVPQIEESEREKKSLSSLGETGFVHIVTLSDMLLPFRSLSNSSSSSDVRPNDSSDHEERNENHHNNRAITSKGNGSVFLLPASLSSFSRSQLVVPLVFLTFALVSSHSSCLIRS